MSSPGAKVEASQTSTGARPVCQPDSAKGPVVSIQAIRFDRGVIGITGIVTTAAGADMPGNPDFHFSSPALVLHSIKAADRESEAFSLRPARSFQFVKP
jgi:hypothetical protein